MVNNTFNPTITGNLFYFYAPPMGHSFNPLLHQPLIPPLDQQMSCHFTDFHPRQINRFHLVGHTVILYLGTSFKKNKINYGSLTGQLYQLNTTEIQLMSTRFKLSFLESYKCKNNAKNTLNWK